MSARFIWAFFGLVALIVIAGTVALCITWYRGHSYERLIAAIRRGDIDGVRRELQRHVDVNRTFSVQYPPMQPEEETPLMLAASAGDVSIVAALLDAGADSAWGALNGRGALHYALGRRGNLPVVRLLIDRGAPLESSMPPLVWAALVSDVDAVGLLLQAGCDPNAASAMGVAPLHDAAYSDDDRKILLLLEHGANIECRDSAGATPLMWASTKGAEMSVRVLLESGADVNARDAKGASALSRAVGREDPREVVRILVEAGADVNGADADGKTPLMEAVMSGSADGLKALLAAGADVNARDSQRRTALMYIDIYGDRTEIVDLLIDAGIDVEAMDTRGKNALGYAIDVRAPPEALARIRSELPADADEP